jgi:hypothetical protein
MSMERRLTVSEVAEAIRASEDSVLRLIAGGALTASNVGAGKRRARWIVAETELARFLASRSNAPGPARRNRTPRSRAGAPAPNYF